jgi:pimeloyl-ACP methyl ester carboxylesterase
MRQRKLLARIAGAIALAILIICVAGIAYNTLSIRHYRELTGVPGKLYDIGGHAMHLYCTGEGSPAIVLSAGLGDDFTGWARVQPILSRLTKVCSYDRAGFGWSESRPGVQDADAISAQLHALMDAAAIQRPFILVGHSISGIYMRSYAAHYLDDLAGLVFIDGATPLQDDRLPKALVKIEVEQRRQMPWQKLLTTLGWDRMQGLCTDVPPGFEAYSAWIMADNCIPSQVDAVEGELDAEQASGEETIHAGPFGGLPVLILSRDPGVLSANWPPDVAKDNSIVWNQMQEEAKHLSSQSKRVIAKGSDHYIHNDRTDLVNQEIGAFLGMVRDHQAFQGNQLTIEE